MMSIGGHVESQDLNLNYNFWYPRLEHYLIEFEHFPMKLKYLKVMLHSLGLNFNSYYVVLW